MTASAPGNGAGAGRGSLQEVARRLHAARFGAQHRQVRPRRQAGALALAQLALGKGREVVADERLVERMGGIPGLDPHLAARGLRGVAPGAAAGLHEQREQALRRAEVAAEEGTVRVHGRHQRHATEVVALGHHLRADEDVDVAGMDGTQARFERALGAGAVGVDARDARRAPVRPSARSAASCSSRRSVPRPIGAMSRLPQSGQARGTRSVRPQWWQRSVRSSLWKTRQALQCGQALFQLQSGQ